MIVYGPSGGNKGIEKSKFKKKYFWIQILFGIQNCCNVKVKVKGSGFSGRSNAYWLSALCVKLKIGNQGFNPTSDSSFLMEEGVVDLHGVGKIKQTEMVST